VTLERAVAIDSVRVDGRYRKDFGDIDALARDIEANGLIHPIALTTDCRLIAGERRLRAVRSLGWARVPVRYLENVTDAAAMLRAERSENTCRKDMLPGEIASLGAALEELERPKAAARQASTQLKGRTGTAVLGRRTGTATENSARTSEVIAAGLGVSARTYERTRAVHKAANNESLPKPERDRAQRAMDEMDRTETVTPVYTRWKAGEEFTPAEPEPTPVATTNGPTIQKPKKQAPRKPLPDAARLAGYELQKSVERIERIVADDRFPQNAQQVATHLRHHLLRSIDALTEALTALPNSEKETTE
jgi:ParB-like chromosome segregation protein Spo0J